ncbi:MAG: hypothetical protein LBR36_03580, partial [Bacteroidales bacterium]|nr:hypothetical protein [Bacteroidales bacterium]
KLAGTKWKLEGIVNEQTGEMQILVPTDCEECYTLEFDTDSTDTGKSTTNEQLFDFNSASIFIGTTKINEIGEDGNLYYDLLFKINSYQFFNDVLYFYCTLEGINYVLKFKKLLQ